MVGASGPPAAAGFSSHRIPFLKVRTPLTPVRKGRGRVPQEPQWQPPADEAVFTGAPANAPTSRLLWLNRRVTTELPEGPRIFEYWTRRREGLLQRYRFRGPRPSLAVMFMNDPAFGGNSKFNGTIAEIELREGTLLCLVMFFAAALSHPQCFRDIGEPTVETEERPEFEELSAHQGDLLVNRWRETTDIPLPKCPVRRDYVFHLTDLALDTVMHHEMVHIFHGHAGLIQDVESSGAAALTDVERKTLEWDADICGVSKTLARQLTVTRHQLENPGSELTSCKSLSDAVRDVVIAFSAIVVLHQAHIRLRVEDPTHMTIRERAAAMICQVRERATVWAVGDEETIQDLVMATSASVERAYRCVTGREPDIDSVFAGLYSFLAYMPTLLETWGNLVARLEPFACVNLPPVQPPPPGGYPTI